MKTTGLQEAERWVLQVAGEKNVSRAIFKVIARKVAIALWNLGCQRLVNSCVNYPRQNYHSSRYVSLPVAGSQSWVLGERELSCRITLLKNINTYALKPSVPTIIVHCLECSHRINVEMTHHTPDYCHWLYRWMHPRKQRCKSINHLALESTCKTRKNAPSGLENQLVFF